MLTLILALILALAVAVAVRSGSGSGIDCFVLMVHVSCLMSYLMSSVLGKYIYTVPSYTTCSHRCATTLPTCPDSPPSPPSPPDLVRSHRQYLLLGFWKPPMPYPMTGRSASKQAHGRVRRWQARARQGSADQSMAWRGPGQLPLFLHLPCG